MDSRQDPDRQGPAPRPPWEPAQAQYRAVWQLDARRKTRRSRWLAVIGAAALVLIAGAWVGYLAGSGDGGWQRAAAPLPVPSTSPADTYSPGPDAAMAERLDTTVLEGGSDLLATTVVRAHPAPAVCPPGSDPDQPGPTGHPRPDPTGSYGWRAAFHGPSGRVILLDTSVPSDPRAWAFDVCRNTWGALAAPPRELGSIDDLVFDADSGLMAAFPASGRAAWTLNVDTGAWVRLADHQRAALPVERAPRVYDPGTGLIVGRADTGEVTALDVESGERALVRQVGEVPLGYGQLVYHATADEIVLIQPVLLGTQGHRVAIWRLNPRSGRWTYDWSPSGAPLAVPWPPAIAHDAASGVTVVAGQTIELAGQGARVTEVIGYEPGYIERMYIGTDDGIAHCATRAIVYDTVNNRVVCVGGVRYSFDPRGRLVGISDVTDVTAFDVTRRTWVRLQEP